MFLKSLTLSNILSFGPEPHTVELGPLNVIIGPNGSGKSNFIEVIGLLKAAPKDIRDPIRGGGGIDEWIWKGDEKDARARIQSQFLSKTPGCLITYDLKFFASLGKFSLDSEDFMLNLPGLNDDNDFAYDVRPSTIMITDANRGNINNYDYGNTSLSQISKLLRFARESATPEVESFIEHLLMTSIYDDFIVNRDSLARAPQRADLPNVYLSSDLSNFGLIINKVRRNIDSREKLKNNIRELNELIDDVDVQIEGGTVQVFVYEGRIAVPATRLSSGTLRFLCLLAILLHPDPPPLICIEEPELGLHPDLIPTVSRLLKEASERTQIIVTTHSDILVDTMTDHPEAVLVAEKSEGGTRLTRLDPERLKPWLDGYRLGQLWTRGDLGGTRW